MAAPRSRGLVALAVIVALLALALLIGTGPGVRAGVWTFRTGFTLLRWAAYLGIAGVVLSLLALAAARPRGGAAALVVIALIAAAASAYFPWHWQQRARAVPPIHDITTDPQDPPAFVAILPLRAGSPNSPVYGGPDIAAQQARAYPDIRPLHLDQAPSMAFDRALDAARQMGWQIVATDPAAGRIEATATTPWFGFHDDIVIRVRPDVGGSRVDVRSESRVGKSDVGTNAARVRAYLARLKG